MLREQAFFFFFFFATYKYHDLGKIEICLSFVHKNVAHNA